MPEEECPLCDEPPEKFEIDWIQCEQCNQWFHTECAELTRIQASQVAQYHCESCAEEFGPSLMKRASKRQSKRIDYVALNEEGSIRNLSFHPHDSKMLYFQDGRGKVIEVDDSFDQPITDSKIKELVVETQLKTPIVLRKANKIICKDSVYQCSFKFPKLSMDDITDAVGEFHEVEVMDVLTQSNEKWSLGKWRQYFKSDPESRSRLKNVISFEFSETPMNSMVEIPEFVKQVDFLNTVWGCKELTNVLKRLKVERPVITKYCLMSVAQSFTDFHIDFSGTSVYYTVIQGEKTFLMFPPTFEIVSAFHKWSNMPSQQEVWFPDLLTEDDRRLGAKITLHLGDLMLLPPSWIHCVHTPLNSIVIGGNFLTLFNLDIHISAFKMENSLSVEKRFRFPRFIDIMWLTALYYLNYNSASLSEAELASLAVLGDFLLECGGRKNVGGVDVCLKQFQQRFGSSSQKRRKLL